ncbi:hypothetical protein SUGI_1199930 [Cryptomeria japonica]|nr:hypothetical protein SUGI_1199930 [Cryptomeria japonica]
MWPLHCQIQVQALVQRWIQQKKMMNLQGVNKISVLLLLSLCSLLTVYTSAYEDFEAYPSGNLSSFDLGDGGIHKLLQVFNQSNLFGASLSNTAPRKCNLFKGSWVKDNSYPLYTDGQCPYVNYKSSCRKNGRPDGDYEKWRWKPHACNMPRFNATDMLQRLRGKRLMFVGDSISQSQWESLTCLLYPFVKQNTQSAISSKRRLQPMAAFNVPVRQFKIPEYKASIDFFWDPLLVEIKGSKSGKNVLDLDSIKKYGKRWKNVDILIFETSHWWNHEGSLRSWDQIKVDGRVYKATSDPMKAYRRALITWSNWVSANLDPRKNMVFFRTMSPKHIDIGSDRHNCYNKVEPDKKKAHFPPIAPQVGIVKRVIKKTRYPVRLLDISLLSSYRIDGHPSIYTKLILGSQNSDLQSSSDCSHWCLPGVPDTWNELLYASLVMN